jgi:hypothetical protein
MCLATQGRLQGWVAKLLLVRWISRYFTKLLKLTGVCLITYIDFSSKPDLAISSYSGGLVSRRSCPGCGSQLAPSELATGFIKIY